MRSAVLKCNLQWGLQCLCRLARLVSTCAINPQLQPKPKAKIRRHRGSRCVGSIAPQPGLELSGAHQKGGLPRAGTCPSQHRLCHATPVGPGEGVPCWEAQPPRTPSPAPAEPPLSLAGLPRNQPTRMPRTWEDHLCAFQMHLNKKSAPQAGAQAAQSREVWSSRGCLCSLSALVGLAGSWTREDPARQHGEHGCGIPPCSVRAHTHTHTHTNLLSSSFQCFRSSFFSAVN